MTAGTERRVAGRYQLLEPIGRGGMGVVWRAHDQLLDRPVAVKEVLYHALSEEDRAAFNRRTIREARAAGRLDHPSVVVVHDVIEEDGRPWIVMQLVRSRSLGEVLRANGPLAPRTVAEIGGQVLDALRSAHASGVLHRDVKPENVLLTDAGRVVLTDFGIATMPEETALTTTGGLTGTPAFIPPERLQGLPAVPESDLWSLGATLYAAVEGRPPFDRGAPVPTMAAVLSDEPDPARRAGPLGPVIAGLLRKDPAERMSAADAAEALRRVAAGGKGSRRGEPSRGRRGRSQGAAHSAAGQAPAAASAGQAPWGPTGEPGQAAWSPAGEPGQAAWAAAGQAPGSGTGDGSWATARQAQGNGAGEGGEASWATASGPGQAHWPTVERANGRPEARRRRRTSAVALFAGVPLLLAAAGVGGWYGYQRLAASDPPPPPSSGGPTPTAAWPASSSPSPTPRTTPSEAAVPAGWHTHVDPLGFSIALPDDWAEFGREKTRVRFRLPGAASFLLIDLTPWPDKDPYQAKTIMEKQAQAEKRLPGYRPGKFFLGKSPWGGQTLEWQFTWRMSTGLAHVADRYLTTGDGRQFAVYWHTTDARWKADYSYYLHFTKTFRPS
ncbi:serine/threonine-protein kinase [Sphaerisporangium fuscum]|uniref:serine/threonine-protein kinase n=1 Tax=Sphaerisporangium fuscum TaxID=2835868 RepID=UPI002029ABA0|nr:serine/threonine-protein kinase [Sphaerisporangium fuscum]